MNYKQQIKYNGGAAMMILVIFFVFISLTILVGIVNPTVREFKIATDSFKSKQTYFLAESGIEDVLYKLRHSKQTSNSETLVLGNSQTVTTVRDIMGNQKEIVSLGNTDSIQRKVNIILDTGVGTAFSYGVQIGTGGLLMDNNSKIIGSVYANGEIKGSGTITGSATSANSPSLNGLIDGVKVGTGSVGNAYSHEITNTTISGTNYCQIGSGNNKACDTSKTDPVQVAMPVSAQNIQDWKDSAVSGGTITGNYILPSNLTLGPKKITGDLTINGKHTFTMDGTIWVQGNLILDNNSIIKLSSSYGTSEGVIIVDGTITIGNNATFQGSGAVGSYMMALTTSSSTSAINLSNNAGAVALYAANGTINVSNNGDAISLTGYYIHLGENAVITYQEGLANANFISGPSGTWNVKSWKEVE